MDFGDILKDLRLEKNITQKELADKLNISSAMISNYENKINIPRDFKILIDIANYFQISVDKLIGNEKIKRIENELTSEETEMIETFRELPRKEKEDILEFIDFKYQKFLQNKKLSNSQQIKEEKNEKKEA